MPDSPTHELSRTVRFTLDPSGREAARPGVNTFAASPVVPGLGLFVAVDVRCCGRPDPDTGYLVDIGDIDRMVRDRIAPALEAALGATESLSPPALLAMMLDHLADLRPEPSSIRWHLTPYASLEMTIDDPTRIALSQHFEFAAAHRLHCDDLSEEENRRLFGKCNNPNGHGHNYRLQVVASTRIDPQTGLGDLGLEALEQVVREQVLDRFDHRHLNLDTEEFRTLIPSVENIAVVCHRLLDESIRAVGGTLQFVTVWETEKTCCTYPIPDRGGG